MVIGLIIPVPIELLYGLGQRLHLTARIKIDAPEGESDLLLQLKFMFGHASAQNMNLAAIDMCHIQNRLDRRSFTCTVDTDKTHNVPLLQLERNIFELKTRIFLVYVPHI
ncbi:hypothetical protein D1872_263160 [compost metagenome]